MMALLRPRQERTVHWYGAERAFAWLGAALGGFGCVPIFTRMSDWAVFENGPFEGALTLGFLTLVGAFVLDGLRWVATRRSATRFRFSFSAFTGGFWIGVATIGGTILAILNTIGPLVT